MPDVGAHDGDRADACSTASSASRELLAHLEVQALGNLDPHIHFAILSDFRDAAGRDAAARRRRSSPRRARASRRSTRSTATGGADRFFLFHRARQWNAQRRRCGWDGSASAARSRSSTACCAARPTPASSSQVGDLVDPAAGALLHHARHRHAAAARRRAAADRHHRASAEPADASIRGRAASPRATASCSRASASRSRARPARCSRGSTPGTPASTRTRPRCPTPIRTCSARASSPARASTTSTRSSRRSRARARERAAVARPVRGALRARRRSSPTSRWSTTIRRACSRTRGGSTAGSAATGRSCSGCFRSCRRARGLKRNPLPLIAPLEDPRQPAPQPRRADAARAARRRLDGAAGRALVLDGDGRSASSRRSCCRSLARLLVGPRRAQSLPVFWRNLRDDAATALAQVVLSVTFLAYHACETVHAIVLTLVRSAVTQRRLLEWETAAAAAARAAGLVGGRALRRFVAEMIASPIIAVGRRADRRVDATATRCPSRAPFLAAVDRRARRRATGSACRSAPRERPLERRASATLLRRTARKTWRYFETFVTDADAWLPPDNYQETATSRGWRTARRRPTSAWACCRRWPPTTSATSTTDALVERLDATLTTLEGLERYEGHFLNWYDTATLAPLHPRYVSTVDSGNLAGALIALAQGLLELDRASRRRATQLLDRPGRHRRPARDGVVVEPRRAIRPTRDAVDRRQSTRARDRRRRSRRESTGDAASRARRRSPASSRTRSPSRQRRGRSSDARRRSRSGAARCCDARRGAATRAADRVRRRAARRSRGRAVGARRRRCGSTSSTTAGGASSRSATASPTPRVPGGSTRSFYDLLASEARLASFVAIAKGDVPQHHWFHLGRLVTTSTAAPTLMSWGGTMFEYLMPLLLMRSFPGTLLDQSCRAQRAPADRVRRGSAACRGAFPSRPTRFTDRAGNYQYRRSACPASASSAAATTSSSRRTPPRWPASVAPAAAAENFERLARAASTAGSGSTRRSTTTRAAATSSTRVRDASAGPAVVRAFFAHHQGMSLVALANVICDDTFVARFHADRNGKFHIHYCR